jgi:DNA-binding MarR family transcriptional regulator
VSVDYEARYLSEPGAVGLFTRLTRVGLLVEAFQHRCLDPFGLRFIDYSVLRVLELVGEPHCMSPTELSEIVVRSSGGMTQILDRLERAELVARAPDPADRRKVLVALTERYAAERERLLADLSPDEVQRLDDAIHRLLEVMTADSTPRSGVVGAG